MGLSDLLSADSDTSSKSAEQELKDFCRQSDEFVEVEHSSFVWEVRHWIDDLDGPEWQVIGPTKSFRNIRTKSDAVKKAFAEASKGDVIQIWDKNNEQGEPNLEYVH